MTASERSYVGLSVQSAKGALKVTDAEFDYFLFLQGGIGPQNVIVPLDQEVGGGALMRSMIKAGVTSAGAFDLIPRPDTLGQFLYGALGATTVTAGVDPDTSAEHVFTLPADQFAAPYFTFRSAPGNMWGETFQDVRLALLSLNWRAADYLRGSVAFTGGEPTGAVSTAAWNAQAQVDRGPQFLAPKATIQLPTGTPIKVLSGSLTMGMNIPLDEQWIVGSYSPDDFDINSRAFALSLNVKLTDSALYNKAQYDPAGAGAWAAEIFREGNFLLEFLSDQDAYTNIPYSLVVEANGQSGDNANVAWSAQPIGLRAGRQVVMNLTGTFLASPTVDAPITVTLVNQRKTQYGTYPI